MAIRTSTTSCRRFSLGRGGNFFTPGRQIIYQRETPVTNLFATMAQRMGVRPDHIGDSTGQLKQTCAMLPPGYTNFRSGIADRSLYVIPKTRDVCQPTHNAAV